MIDTGQLKKQILTSSFESLPNYLYEPLGNHVIFERGITFPASEKKAIREIGTIPCIRTANIQENLDISDLIYVSERFVKNNKKLIRSDDIFISMANSRELVGKSCMVSENTEQMTFGGFVTVARSIDVHQRYLYFYLKYLFISSKMLSIASQTTNIANISSKSLQSLSIPLPPLEEQKRIVAKIEELFAKIDEIDKAQKELKELAELAEKKVLDMAVRGELSYARPGDSNVDDMLSVLRNKKEVGIRNGSIKLEKPYNTSREFELKPFEIPSYWRFERLGSISINLDNFRIPLKNQERQKMNNKHFPYYGASGIIDKVDDYLFDKKLLLVSEDGANLLSRSSPIAFTASGKYWVNNHAHVLDTTEEIDKDYLCCYLESISIAPYVTGSAQPKITQANLNAIWVPVPPIEEQSRIATTVSLFRAQFSTINS